MINHEFVVQYNFSAKMDDEGTWQYGEESWNDDSNYEFSFKPEDPKSKETARNVATACVLWLQYQEKDDPDDFQIPFRVIHRITSDEVV